MGLFSKLMELLDDFGLAPPKTDGHLTFIHEDELMMDKYEKVAGYVHDEYGLLKKGDKIEKKSSSSSSSSSSDAFDDDVMLMTLLKQRGKIKNKKIDHSVAYHVKIKPEEKVAVIEDLMTFTFGFNEQKGKPKTDQRDQNIHRLSNLLPKAEKMLRHVEHLCNIPNQEYVILAFDRDWIDLKEKIRTQTKRAEHMEPYITKYVRNELITIDNDEFCFTETPQDERYYSNRPESELLRLEKERAEFDQEYPGKTDQDYDEFCIKATKALVKELKNLVWSRLMATRRLKRILHVYFMCHIIKHPLLFDHKIIMDFDYGGPYLIHRGKAKQMTAIHERKVREADILIPCWVKRLASTHSIVVKAGDSDYLAILSILAEHIMTQSKGGKLHSLHFQYQTQTTTRFFDMFQFVKDIKTKAHLSIQGFILACILNKTDFVERETCFYGLPVKLIFRWVAQYVDTYRINIMKDPDVFHKFILDIYTEHHQEPGKEPPSYDDLLSKVTFNLKSGKRKGMPLMKQVVQTFNEMCFNWTYWTRLSLTLSKNLIPPLPPASQNLGSFECELRKPSKKKEKKEKKSDKKESKKRKSKKEKDEEKKDQPAQSRKRKRTEKSKPVLGEKIKKQKTDAREQKRKKKEEAQNSSPMDFIDRLAAARSHREEVEIETDHSDKPSWLTPFED